ncbi:MAG: hypothetical protein JSR36_04615 [Proteobacteria bacterium]|nr:hypothetical protein [Pseudomonadota bacterium]
MLRRAWEKLHRGDREPWPDARLIARRGSAHPGLGTWIAAHGQAGAVAEGLQAAWGEFHAGDFRSAIKRGSELDVLGASVANKAAAIHALHSRDATAQQTLEAAIARGEAAVRVLDDSANTHYTLALVLGRYGQHISIARAIAQGFAGRVRTHLDRAIELESRHAEAHVALGLYHAEILGKLGSLAASLTFGVSASAALDHFRRAVSLAPDSPIVRIEYANGLLLLDRTRYRDEARALYRQAAACQPLDAMERLDVQRAQGGVKD